MLEDHHSKDKWQDLITLNRVPKDREYRDQRQKMTYRCAGRRGSGRIESTGGRYNKIYNVPVLEDCGRQSRV
jgi:hypothetical protein